MHVSHASSLAVSLLTKDYGSLGSAPSGTSGQSGALLAPPITLCDDCQHDKLATAFGHYVKKRGFPKATSRSALAFSVATSPASKTATRFRRSRRWRKWPAHLRSPSINSSTKARNRLSCPISRNARLGTRPHGAAPAKTPVFWPSSAGCWVAWTKASESCCCTWRRKWLAGRRDQAYLSGGGSPLARLVRDFFLPKRKTGDETAWGSSRKRASLPELPHAVSSPVLRFGRLGSSGGSSPS